MKRFLILIFALLTTAACSKQQSNDQSPGTDEIVKISTEYGDMYVVLYDETPIHKENFIKLVKEGFYDSTTFHRVIPEFMIQGGDPNSKDDIPFNDGQGGPGYTQEAEFNSDLIHKKGALAAARLGDQQNPQRRSSGSQFYIVQGKPVSALELDQIQEGQNQNAKQIIMRDYIQAPENRSILEALRRNQSAGRIDSVETILKEVEEETLSDYIPKVYSPEQRELYASLGGTPFLDDNYTVFGEVIQGLDIVDKIAAVETGQADRPVTAVSMTMTIEEMDRDAVEEKFGYTYH